MYEAKTKATAASVDAFIKKIADEQKRKDSYELIAMMKKATGEPPKLWGASIVGFGSVHYKYASGHEGDTCRIGFSPRKAAISLYLLACLEKKDAGLFEKLGKYKRGVGCVYIKKLDDIDRGVLKKLIESAIKVGKR
ncbi:MAG: DUF1801 domain-containing protein [Planctomycetes bacterium]|nr:DUF1801 domain-containing protein [Planctomycetota bacterium]